MSRAQVVYRVDQFMLGDDSKAEIAELKIPKLFILQNDDEYWGLNILDITQRFSNFEGAIENEDYYSGDLYDWDKEECNNCEHIYFSTFTKAKSFCKRILLNKVEQCRKGLKELKTIKKQSVSKV